MLHNKLSPCDLWAAELAFHRLYHKPTKIGTKIFHKGHRDFKIPKNFKSEIANYQDSVSSGNDKLTSIGLECKIVNAAVRKYFPSELPQKQRKISADNKVLTTVRPCPYHVLYRPMLVTLSCWKKKTTSYISIRRELWDGRGNQRRSQCFMGTYFYWREMRAKKKCWLFCPLTAQI